jgi:TonB-linked SusC/RagA family outer membrane protein
MRRSVLGRFGPVLTALALFAIPSVAAAQNAVIRGTVRSDAGDPVVGGNVYIVELNLQAATSDAGRFTLTVPGDRVRGQQLMLRARAVGYRPASRSITIVAGEQTVDFQLVQDVNRLDEIVVTGVLEGTEQGRVPFAVSRVDMADVPVIPIDPIRLLAGRVPGANVTSFSGRPGAAPEVILRGPRSINATGRSQGPLYILDGTIIQGDLPSINPADIENVEVVKGAAASSLYGARGGNGVISITTRSGRRSADGMTFNVRSEMGRSDIERDFGIARNHYLVMDSRNERFCRNVGGLCTQTLDWQAEAARINNAAGDFALTPLSLALDVGGSANVPSLANRFMAQRYPGRIYNAVEQAVTPQEMLSTNVDASGRFGQTQFFVSGSYLDQAGALRLSDGFERYTGRLNVDQQLGTAWQFQMRTFYSRSREDFTAPGFFRLTRAPAIVNTLQRDTLGRLYIRPNIQGSGAQNENPLYTAENLVDIGTTRRFIGGLNVSYTPVQWLSVEGLFAYDYSAFSEDAFQDKGYRSTQQAAVANSSFLGTPYIGYAFSGATNTQSFNTGLNVSARRNLASGIVSRWTLRYAYDQQDVNSRSGDGTTLNAVGVPTLNNASVRNSIASSATSVRGASYAAGVNLDIRDRYVVDGVVRREGSSLFGSESRWSTFGRGSIAWRVSREGWWFADNLFSDFKLRASYGTAGARPRFVAQYETFSVGAGGIGFQALGNRLLRPEKTFDTEVGIDAEVFNRVGVNLTYARAETRDQILEVVAPAHAGFTSQWRNAGTLENKTWELSINVPVIQRRDVQWSWRFNYDRTRTVITETTVPPQTFGPNATNAGNMFLLQAGEPYGNIRAKRFLRSCSELPDHTAGGGPDFSTLCGSPGSPFQINSDGYVVWTGGFGVGEGINRNLWGTSLASANAPWGRPLFWGMPITVRSPACTTTPSASCPAELVELGASALPKWNFSISQNFSYRRFSVYALMQGVMGRSVWNQGRHWAHLDLLDDDIDQGGRSPELAKPIGYYWRGSAPDGSGVGGFYDALQANNHFVESTDYAKLRELAVSYNLGPVGGVGNWTLSLVGRNLFTITNYSGFDPEVGVGGGLGNSGLLGAADAFGFPNTRSLTFGLSTSF